MRIIGPSLMEWPSRVRTLFPVALAGLGATTVLAPPLVGWSALRLARSVSAAESDRARAWSVGVGIGAGVAVAGLVAGSVIARRRFLTNTANAARDLDPGFREPRSAPWCRPALDLSSIRAGWAAKARDTSEPPPSVTMSTSSPEPIPSPIPFACSSGWTPGPACSSAWISRWRNCAERVHSTAPTSSFRRPPERATRTPPGRRRRTPIEVTVHRWPWVTGCCRVSCR